MEENSLSYKTLKNVSYSFLGYALPIVFSVFITPVIVHKLGIVDFGVYVLVNTITGFLLLMDLGLGTAILKYVAEYRAAGNSKDLQVLLKTGNFVFLCFGLLGLLAFFVLGKYFLPFFNIAIQSQNHILVVFLLAGGLFVLNSLSTFYISVTRAMQRYDITVTQNLAQLTAIQILSLVLVLMGYKLKAIFGVSIGVTAVLVLVQYFQAKKLLPGMGFGLGWSWEQIKKGYRFGVGAFITNISGTALVQIDKLLIPIFLGPAPLTFYSLPGNVAQKINGITGASSGIFFPLMSSLQGAGEGERIKIIYTKLFRNVTIFSAGLAVPIAFFADKILLYWLGAEFARQGTTILIILAATYFILGVQGPLINFLLGLGRVRFLMKYSVFMALVNLGLVLWWVPKYGIMGAAWAYFVSVLPIIFMFYQAEKNILQLSGRAGSYFVLYGKLIITAAVFWLVATLYNPLIHSLAGIIIAGPLSVLFFYAIYRLFNFYEKEDRELYMGFLKSAGRRLRLLR